MGPYVVGDPWSKIKLRQLSKADEPSQTSLTAAFTVLGIRELMMLMSSASGKGYCGIMVIITCIILDLGEPCAEARSECGSESWMSGKAEC